MPDHAHAPRVTRHEGEEGPVEREELDRLRRPGIDPMAKFVVVQRSQPTAPERVARPRKKRTRKPESESELSRRAALRSLVMYAKILKADIVELQDKLLRAELSIGLVGGKLTVEQALKRLKRARGGK